MMLLKLKDMVVMETKLLFHEMSEKELAEAETVNIFEFEMTQVV